MQPILWLNHAHSSQRDVLALIKSDLGDHIRTIASHKDFREEILMAADECFVEPRRSETTGPDYAIWALETAIERGVAGLLAMRHRRSLLNAAADFAAAGIRLAAGATAAETIALCDDKDAFTAHMEAAGFPMPRTIGVSDAAGLRAAIAGIEADGGQACIKPAFGIFGQGFRRFDRRVRAFEAFSALEPCLAHPEIYAAAYEAEPAPPRMIVMEYLPGPEHSIDCVVDSGRLRAAAARRKSDSCQLVTTEGPEIALAAKVAEHLQLDGLINVQTRGDRHGVTRLLEVNTRPSGGVGYSAAAGVNLPALCARMLLGQPVAQPRLPGPVAIRRLDQAIALPETTARLARSETVAA